MLSKIVIILVVNLGFVFNVNAVKKCPVVTSGEKETVSDHNKKFSLSKKGKHFARTYGSLLDMNLVKVNLSRLTGLVKLDEEGCIQGRCSDEQKERVRDFLMLKLEEFGLNPRVEGYKTSVMALRQDETNSSDLIDFQTMTKDQFERLTYYEVSGTIDWFKKVTKTPYDLKAFKKMTKENWVDLLAEVERILKDEKLEQEYILKYDVVVEHVKIEVKDILKDIEKIEKINQAKSAAKKKKSGKKPKYNVNNVVVEIPGSILANEIVEVNAHYDTTADHKPGADDNGSGVVTVLELARIFAKSKPKRTIRLVIADLEEFGFVGTSMHVEQSLKNKDNVVAALVVDTIGYAPISHRHEINPKFVVELGNKTYHESSSSYQASKIVTETLYYQFNRYKERYSELDVVQEDALPGTADHGPYWDAGIPAVLIAAPYSDEGINPGYHKTTDVIYQYNWGYFEDISRFIVESVALLAEASPSKIKVDPVITDYFDSTLDESVSPDSKNVKKEKRNFFWDSSLPEYD